MKSKFVSAMKPTDYAEQLHQIQRKLDKLEKERKELVATEKHLIAYLLRFSKGESFTFNSKDGNQKKVKIGNHSRLILDTDAVKKLLKTRTPYKTSSWTSVNVDWVYV